MKSLLTLIIMFTVVFTLTAYGSGSTTQSPQATAKPASTPAQAIASPTAASTKPTLTYFGQASLKIKTTTGTVIYIDPFAPGDYSEKADIILVSHEHPDHNKIELVTQNSGCRVLRVTDTINKDNSYNTFTIKDVKIEPVPAGGNKNHQLYNTNGFVLTFDGIVVYHAADTSKLDSMAKLKLIGIDYAFFPIDGQANMGPVEATECTKLIEAKHNTPYHIGKADVKAFTPENLLLMTNGQTIELVSSQKS